VHEGPVQQRSRSDTRGHTHGRGRYQCYCSPIHHLTTHVVTHRERETHTQRDTHVHRETHTYTERQTDTQRDNCSRTQTHAHIHGRLKVSAITDLDTNIRSLVSQQLSYRL